MQDDEVRAAIEIVKDITRPKLKSLRDARSLNVTGTYAVIVADPPWSFGDKLAKMTKRVKRSAEANYDVMDVESIRALDVKSLSAKDCILALWVPGTLLKQGIDVLETWGFTLKQTYNWVKLNKQARTRVVEGLDFDTITDFGMGRLFRQTHELALIGTRGSMYDQLANKSQRSTSFDLNGGHSTKPEKLQNSLDIMFPNAKKLEMFARRERSGWTCIGNGIDGLDIVNAIERLKHGKNEEVR